MTKQRIYALAILLSVVMVGLIVNQSILLRNGITQSQKVFEDQMNDVLGEVSEDLKLYDYGPYVNSVVDSAMDADSIRRDSLVLANLQAIFDFTIFLKEEKAVHTFELVGDSSQEEMAMLELLQELKSRSTQSVLIDQDLQDVLSTKSEDLTRKRPEVTDEVIRELLDARLNERSLSISYKLKSLTRPYGGMQLSPYALENASYFERLVFKNELSGEYHGKLMVWVNNRNQYVWYQNLVFIITSVLLILFVSAGFVFSVTTILRQRKISDLKTAFINNMTHELKTPVATIGIASQMLHEDNVMNESEKVLKYAEIIREENNRLGSHIEKVLQVAQLEQGSIKLNMKEVDVHQILDKLESSYKLRIEAANGVLIQNRQASNHHIYGDEQHIYNVFSNLYDNAIKYSKEKLTLSVTTRSNQQFIEVIIRDNGIGMSSSVQRHIFDAFFRESSGNIHNVKGFGLGLSYVKAMTERHQGSVSVQSEEGQFAEFTLIFPLNNEK